MPVKKKVLKVKRSNAPKVKDKKGVQDSFDYILKMVRDKWTISEAVELANVDRAAFYKYITLQQKNELHQAKAEHTIVGSMWKITAGSKKQPSSKTQNQTSSPQELRIDDFDFDIEPSTNHDWDF